MSVSIRSVTPDDVDFILKCITDLAIYENALDQVEATPAMIHEELFGNPRKCSEAIIAEISDNSEVKKVGFALFFHNFSTWRGRRGIWIEDVFVQPEFRGRGVGTTLLSGVAKIAKERNCGRMDWSCLDWNTPSLDFYEGPVVGAKRMKEWLMLRVGSDEGIEALSLQK